VKEIRADIGIALDGDGDRVLIADERGRIVDGDQLLAGGDCGELEGGRPPSLSLAWVATVMSNLGSNAISGAWQSRSRRTPVGDRYVLEHMRATKAVNVGGESSATSSCPITPRRAMAC